MIRAKSIGLALTVAMIAGLGLTAGALAAGETLVFVAGPQGNVLWEQVIPMWEQDTGNKIKFTDVPRENFDAFLKARIAAGSQIDVIMYDPLFHLDYFEHGIPADITEAFSDPGYPNLKEANFKAGALDFKRMAGHIYFIPLNLIMTLYYYNKDIYQEYGIQPPARYEDEVQIADKLDGTGIIPMAYAGKEIWWNPMMFYRYIPMVTANNSDAFTKATIRGDIKWTSPFYIRALELLKGEMDDGVLTPESLGLDYDTLTTIFVQDRVATIYQGTWFYSEQLKAAREQGFNLGVTPIPSVSPGHGQPCGSADVNLSIYSGTDYMEEALDFLNFSASKKVADIASNHYVSAIAGAVPNDPVLAEVVEMYQDVAITNLVDHLWEPEITEAFKVQVQNLLLDMATPEEVAQYVQDVHDDLVAEGKSFGPIFGKDYSYQQ